MNLTSDIKQELQDAEIDCTDGLVEQLAQLLGNSAECANCDGHCCSSFIAITSHDKRPWSRKRAAELVLKRIGWMRNGEPYIVGDEVHIPCRCDHWIGNRCSTYGERSLACRLFPLSRVLDGDVYEDCKLAGIIDSLLKNQQATRGLII